MTLEIRLKSFEVSLLRRAMGQVAALATTHALHVRTRLGLPGRTKLTTLLRSPHVHKKAREQFHLRTHKGLVILDADPQCAHAFLTALSTLRVLGTQVHITTVSDTYAV